MANLIFVHGAYANEHSWFDIPDAFDTATNNVTAETLPGHSGRFPMPEPTTTLGKYVAQVSEFLSDGDDNWLIGHSMGGMVISQVAADKPDKIAGLIYIAAILPEDGKSTVDYTGIPNPETIFPNHDRSEIRHALGSQPIRALSGTFQSKPGFKDKETYYIACSQDNVIGVAVQESMAQAYGLDPEHLESDHLPMHDSSLQPGIRDELLAKLQDILPY